MLEELHVKNLAIIDEVSVSFGKGLNILTGETGAGKSVIIGSINLALGGRAGKGIVRNGKETGFVELVFSVDTSIKKELEKMDISIEDDILIINRKFTNDRSISKINEETATLSKVRKVASLLLDIHGQTENQTLLLEKNHLEILDKYCKNEVSELKSTLKALVSKYHEKNTELLKCSEDEANRTRELEFLKYECDEIERAKLLKDEEEELDKKVRRYEASSKIIGFVEEIRSLLDEGGTQDSIGNIVKITSRLSAVDESSSELLTQISEIEGLLNDFERTLSIYVESSMFDEVDFSNSVDRLNTIRNIFAKHGNTYEGTMEFYETSLERIERLENFAEYKKELSCEVEELKTEILVTCNKLSTIRSKFAKSLSLEVRSALTDLNFTTLEFEVSVERLESFTEKGNDDVVFKISTNIGEPLRPISEVASGGELSRIMLGIKSVMADTDDIPTLIFDEIDTGISGRTAQMVAEKMAVISKERQLIAITHLAQISAMADNHFLIEKKAESDHTFTNIHRLDENGIINELSRILGGVAITDQIMSSAREMRKLATETKKKLRRTK